jgi:acetyl esterase/lipase
MQALIAAPPRQRWRVPPTALAEWQAAVATAAAETIRGQPAMRAKLGVSVERTELGGVGAFIITPAIVAPENRDRLLMHLHGGCYMLNPGEAGLGEAILMAGIGRFKVISIDYRMPPAAYFPAAHDDALAGWKAVSAMGDPSRMAIFGTSAGGALTLATVLRARDQGLPLPGAIASGTPMADTTKIGDTFYTNEGLDNVLMSRDGFCDAATKVYANGHALSDPLLSPIYGDYAGFPPAILTSGTRDLLLSNTVRVHRKLRQAGVEAVLQVFEGQSHAQYLFDADAPETREAFEEIARFFDRHLGR